MADSTSSTPPSGKPSAAPSEPAAPGALAPELAAALKRDAAGLVCAVVQQHDTREVLMVAWMDDAALQATLTTGRATYFSRSRQQLWRKGDTSGHVQWVRSVSLDCDGDALLVEVDQVGAACHTGERTCFLARPLPVSGQLPPQGVAGSAGPAR